MTERTQINLAVGDEQKQRWNEYADENHRSLSQLIRHAVEKEISGDGEYGSSDDLAEQLSELSEGIQQVGGRMDRMNGRLNDLERVVKQDSPEVADLGNDVFEVLPTEGELVTETHESVIPSSC